LERLAVWLDSGLVVPGTGIRFGWDAVLGLAPVIGDGLTAAIAFYIPWRSWRMGVDTPTLLRMTFNVFVDWAIGQIPLLGDLFDIGFRCNERNVRLLQQSFENRF
jgi:hypothetical protein